jgi:hypothetical protein
MEPGARVKHKITGKMGTLKFKYQSCRRVPMVEYRLDRAHYNRAMTEASFEMEFEEVKEEVAQDARGQYQKQSAAT